jgi:hypothetical protein
MVVGFTTDFAVRRKQTKRQIMVNKTLHRKLTMGHEAPGYTQVLRNGKQFLLHLWHSYISQYRNETTKRTHFFPDILFEPFFSFSVNVIFLFIQPM